LIKQDTVLTFFQRIDDVVCAIMRRAGTPLYARDIRPFTVTHQAPFKVPNKIVFVSEMSKMATGMDRYTGLAKKPQRV